MSEDSSDAIDDFNSSISSFRAASSSSDDDSVEFSPSVMMMGASESSTVVPVESSPAAPVSSPLSRTMMMGAKSRCRHEEVAVAMVDW